MWGKQGKKKSQGTSKEKGRACAVSGKGQIKEISGPETRTNWNQWSYQELRLTWKG